MNKKIGMQFTAVVATCGMLVSGMPALALADSITIVNDNQASVSNAITVSSNTGGNSSRGERGARGGSGGEATANTNADAAAGNGGNGGNGGDGGSITTGDAIATAYVENDVNAIEVDVEAASHSGDCTVETLDMESSVGSSSSAASSASELDEVNTFDMHGQLTHNEQNAEESQSSESSENMSENSSSASAANNTEANTLNTATAANEWEFSESSTNGGTWTLEKGTASSEDAVASTENNTSASSESDDYALASAGSESQGSAAASAQAAFAASLDIGTVNNVHTAAQDSGENAEEHDNLALHTNCVRNGSDDTIAVVGTNAATVDNALTVTAETGDNHVRGERGGRGGYAGDAVALGDDNNLGHADATSGNGGMGGVGGDGGAIVTGVADSLADVVTVTGRTVTRIVRN